MKSYINTLMDHGIELHTTLLKKSRDLPSAVINHGVLNPSEYHELLRKAKVALDHSNDI